MSKAVPYENDCLDGVILERPPWVQEVAGSIPGRFIPKTLKMEVTAALLGTQWCGVGLTTDSLLSGLLDL